MLPSVLRLLRPQRQPCPLARQTPRQIPLQPRLFRGGKRLTTPEVVPVGGVEVFGPVFLRFFSEVRVRRNMPQLLLATLPPQVLARLLFQFPPRFSGGA